MSLIRPVLIRALAKARPGEQMMAPSNDKDVRFEDVPFTEPDSGAEDFPQSLTDQPASAGSDWLREIEKGAGNGNRDDEPLRPRQLPDDPGLNPASAENLYREADNTLSFIREALPGLQVAIVRFEELATAFLQGEAAQKNKTVALGLAHRNPLRHSEQDSAKIQSFLGTSLDSLCEPATLTVPLEQGGNLHVVRLPTAVFSPGLRDSLADYAALRECAVDPEKVTAPALSREDLFNAAADHQLGRVLFAELGSKGRGGSHQEYLDTCRGDAFSIFMATRRGRNPETIAKGLYEARHFGAVLHADCTRWTVPVVAAAATQAIDLMFEGKFASMSANEFANRIEQIVSQKAMDETALRSFDRRMRSFRAGTPLNELGPGEEEAAFCLTAYAKMRQNAILTTPARPVIPVVAAQDRNMGSFDLERLAGICSPYLGLEGSVCDLFARLPSATNDPARARLGAIAAGAFEHIDEIVAAEQKVLRQEGNGEQARSYAATRQAVKSAREIARDISRGIAPTDGRAFSTLARAFENSAAALGDTSPWLAGTQALARLAQNGLREYEAASRDTPSLPALPVRKPLVRPPMEEQKKTWEDRPKGDYPSKFQGNRRNWKGKKPYTKGRGQDRG